jgi:hypothetical protein
MAGAEGSASSPGLALPPTSVVFGTCSSAASWGCSCFSMADWGYSVSFGVVWCCIVGSGASCGCSGSSRAQSSSVSPKILACGLGSDVDKACSSGTTLSALVCSRTCCSALTVLVGGGVALPDSSSGL